MREGDGSKLQKPLYDWTAVWAKYQPVFCFNDDYDGDGDDSGDGDDGMMVICCSQEDFIPPPPMDETAAEKMDRISATIKLSRNEISEIMWDNDDDNCCHLWGRGIFYGSKLTSKRHHQAFKEWDMRYEILRMMMMTETMKMIIDVT